MAITLQDYYTAVLENVPTAATLATQTVFDCINRARRRLAAESDATLALFTFTLTPGTWNYPYDTAGLVDGCSVISILRVWLYIGTTRYELPKSAIKYDYFYTNFASWPIKWWTEKNSLYLWPTPSSNYQMDWQVKKQPNTLAALTDPELEIKYQYSDACQMLCCKYVAMADGNVNLAQFFEGEYQRAMEILPRSNM